MLTHAHRGYTYQDYFTACVLIDVLLKGVTVSSENRQAPGDVFDDVVIHTSNGDHKIQVKSTAGRSLQLQDLTTNQIDARIDKLVAAAASDSVSDRRLVVALTAPPEGDDLWRFVIESTDPPTIPGSDTRRFRLDLDAIWPSEGRPRWNPLRDAGVDRSEFVAFAGSFVVETNCPAGPLDLNEPGQLVRLLLQRLISDVGVGVYPMHARDLRDAAARLVRTASELRLTPGRAVGAPDLIKRMGLVSDFGRVGQDFSVDGERFLERSDDLEQLEDLIHAVETVLVTGAPGQGKSWLVSRLADRYVEAGALVARHYCFISPEDPELVDRSHLETIFGSLIAGLLEADPTLEALHRPRYAADAQSLEQLVTRAHDADPNRPIVLVIDGLDHLSRIGHRLLGPHDLSAIAAEELAALDLAQTRLVITSQPGPHLEPLLSEAEIWEVPQWEANEVEGLAVRLGVPRALDSSPYDMEPDDLISVIADKGGGNPLYVTYLCREIIAACRGERDEAVDLNVYANSVPPYDGELQSYYEWIVSQLDRGIGAVQVPELLSLIDFAVSPDQLRDILPPVAHHVDDTLLRLDSVLRRSVGQGVRIHHESFQRYLVDRLRRHDPEAPQRALGPVIDWLERRGWYDDPIAFRFLVPTLRRADRHGDAIALLQPEYASRAVESGHPQDAVVANIEHISRSAAHTLDWRAIAVCVEMARAVDVAYDSNLREDAQLYGRTLVALKGTSFLAKSMLHEGRPTYAPRIGVILCDLIDQAGGSSPWDTYLEALTQAESSSNTSYPPSEDLAVEKARIRGACRLWPTQLLKNLENWANEWRGEDPESLSYGTHITPGDISVILCQTLGVAEAEALAIGVVNPLAVAEMNLGIAQFLKHVDPEQAAAVAAEAALALPKSSLLHCLRLGVSPREIAAAVEDVGVEAMRLTAELVDPAIRTVRRASVAEWVLLVRLLAILEPERLPEVYGLLGGEGWYRRWLRFIVDCAAAHTPDDLTAALAELAEESEMFRGNPRAVDLYDLERVINATLVDVLIDADDSDWLVRARLLGRISQDTSVAWNLGTSGPLRPHVLFEMLLDQAGNEQRASAALEVIETVVGGLDSPARRSEYYGYYQTYEMLRTLLMVETGRLEDAHASWQRAAIYATAYGFRKDSTIYQLLTPLWAFIKGGHADGVRIRLEALQEMTEQVVAHTDGKGTWGAPGTWRRLLCGSHPEAAARHAAELQFAQGGSLHHGSDEIAEELVKRSMDRTDAYLAGVIPLAVPTRILGVGGALDAFGRVIETDRPLAHALWPAVAAAILGDFSTSAQSAFTDVVAFARDHGLELPALADLETSRPILVADSADSSEAGPHEDRTDIPTAPPIETTPAHVIHWLQESRLSSAHIDEVDEVAADLANRMLWYEAHGRAEAATRLIDHLASDLFHSKERATLLEATARKLAGHGSRHLASRAYAYAFSRSRGASGWGQIGGEESHDLFAAAFDIDREQAFAIVAHDIARRAASGFVGITDHLIEFALPFLGEEEAWGIWDAVMPIIQHRLPAVTRLRSNGAPYFSDRVLEGLDTELTLMILARAAHPGHEHRRRALAALTVLITKRPRIVGSALNHIFSRDASHSTLISILQVLDAERVLPSELIDEVEEQLMLFATTDMLAYRVLSRRILASAGITPPADHLPTPSTPRLIQLDGSDSVSRWIQRGRLDTLDEISPSLANDVSYRFHVLTKEKANEGRLEGQVRAFRSGADRLHARADAVYWDEEIFELALNEEAASIRARLAVEGIFDPEAEGKLAELLLESIPLSVSYELSRTPRPELPHDALDPGSYQYGTVEHLVDDGTWVRVGVWEHILVFSDRDIASARTIQCGLVRLDSKTQGVGPLGWVTPRIWLSQSEDGSARQPQLAGGGWIWSTLGRLPVLSPATDLVNSLGLSNRESSGPLTMTAADGRPAIKMSMWRHWPLSDHSLADERPEVIGIELKVRRDLLETVTRIGGLSFLYTSEDHSPTTGDE